MADDPAIQQKRAQARVFEALARGLQDTEPSALRPLRDLAEDIWAQRRSRPTYQPGAVDPAALRLSEQPADLAELTARVEAEILRPGLNTSSPKHFGWVPGGGTAASALGDYLAALGNGYAGYSVPTPGAVAVEQVLLDWMRDLVGLPEGTAGDLCPGGSLANAVALHAASPRVGRAARGERRDLALLPEDLLGVVYLSEERHRCIDKALGLTGHGGRTRTVAVDARGRMDSAALEAAIQADLEAGEGRPWLVVASAGTTSTGAVDPLNDIADISAKYRVWLHVDAAYGGAFALCPEGAGRLAGIERADSVVLDPHKGLFQPYGIGVVLVREGRRLYAAHSANHAYIREDGAATDNLDHAMQDGSAMFRSPELSRPFRALRLWLSLQVHGLGAFSAALSARLAYADVAWRRLGALPQIEVGPAPDLSIVAFRLRCPADTPADVDGALQEALVLRLRGEHALFTTSTVFLGRTWLRLAILGLQVRLDDVEAAVDAIAQASAGVLAQAAR